MEEQRKRDEQDQRVKDDENAKIQEKIEMNDAARAIQKKWTWFLEEGRFWAKKRKKGKKGKGKKKWSLLAEVYLNFNA